jgi:hypothetical protein
MRKVLISIAAAGTALAFAAPASAQYAPQGYGYQGYGYQGQGYRNGGGFRSLQMRVDMIQRQIEQLGARRVISRNEYNGLRSEARQVERQLRRSARYGFDYREMRNAEYRVARLEQHVRHEVRDGNRWGNGNGYNGYGGNYGQYSDRDRDGRNDRYEDDRGYDRDD